MKISDRDRLPIEECRIRALQYLARHSECCYSMASSVGQHIWPNSELRAQGLGGAASRILKVLEEEKLVRWCSDSISAGWKITRKGQKVLEE